MRTPMGRLRLLQFFLAGVSLIVLAVKSFPPGSYDHDISQDYLPARAMRDGLDPYAPLPDLAEKYFSVRTVHLPTPTNHPPIVLLASVPPSFLPYAVVVPLVLAINLLLLVRIGRRLGLSLHGSLALTAWPPAWWILLVGQFEILFLALAMAAWRAAERGHPWRAGAYLGIAGSIKLYPLVFLLPFIARRQGRVVISAGLVWLVSQLGNVLIVGPAGLARYYTEIVPQVTGKYVYGGLNGSPYGTFLRLFGGSSDVEPLIEIPWLVGPLTVLFCLFGAFALLRLPPQAAPVASLVTLPAAWGYQLVLALPEIVRLFQVRGRHTGLLLAAAAASLVQPHFTYFAVIAIEQATDWTGGRAPPVIGLICALQTVGFIGLAVLSLRTLPPRPTTAPTEV